MKAKSNLRGLFTVFLLFVVSVTSLGFTVDGISYSSSDDSDLSSSPWVFVVPNRYSGDIVIPSTVTYSGKTYIVAGIASNAFKNCTSLKSVSIPETVVDIETDAFNGTTATVTIAEENPVYECTGNCLIEKWSGTLILAAKDCVIPSNVKIIGSSAFRNRTDVTSITIPANVVKIEDKAFSDCSNLSSVTISEGVKKIGDNAFKDCKSLTSITIPGSVASIGNNVFSNCKNLATVNLGEGLRKIGDNAFSGCTSLKTINIPSSVRSMGSMPFENCTSLPVYNLIRYADTYLVGVDDNYRDLESYSIKAGTRFIGTNAFAYCSRLRSVNIPETVISVEKGAFSGCSSLPVEYYIRYAGTCAVEVTLGYLSSYTIREGTTHIAAGAFSNAYSLSSVTIPEGVVSIGVEAFQYQRNLTSVTLPESVKYIGTNAFSGSGLTSVTFPESLKAIGEYAFSGCKITSVTLPDGLDYIGENAFYDCQSLSSLTLLSGLTEIENGVFRNCYNLTSATIPSGVTMIGKEAFHATAITSLSIPASVTYIDRDGAFGNCKSLSSITVDAGNPVYESSGCNVIVEKATKTLVKGCNASTIPNDVVYIGEEAFYASPELTSITIPEGVKGVAGGAFSGCTSLTSITLPNSVVALADEVFEKCTALTSLYIGSGMKIIADGSIGGSKGLTTIKVDAGNPFFDSRNNCNAVIHKSTNILVSGCKGTTIPSNVTAIGDGAFKETGITSVSIPANVKFIGKSAFEGCESLASVTLSEGLDNLKRHAFSECSALRSVIIPSTVTKVGYQAFYQCSNLRTVRCLSSNIDINSSAFDLVRASTFYAPTPAAARKYRNTFSSKFSDYLAINDIKVESITLSQTTANIFNGETITISATVAPEEADPLVTWSSSDTKIATVDDSGNIMGVGPGTVSITASAVDNSGKTAVCKVTVADNILYGSCGSNVKYVLHKDYRLEILGTGDMIDYSSLSNIPWYNYRSQIQSITVSEGVTGIGSFNSCSAATSISIPASVTKIYDSAFYNCTALTKAEFASLESLCGFSFNIYYANPLYYAHHLYINGVEVKDVVIPKGITEIKNYTFAGGSALTSVTIPEDVTQIGFGAFKGCSGLSSITIPEGVKTIYDDFENCSGLTSFTLPSSVTFIGGGALQGCTSLESIIVAEGNDNYDSREGCNAIIKTETNTLIAGCKNSTIPEGVVAIADGVFKNNEQLETITLPSTITNIGKEAFSGCANLYEVNCWARTVPTVGTDAFKDVARPEVLLNVFTSVADSYRNTSPWSLFTVNPIATLPVASIELSEASYAIKRGTQFTLSAAILPADAEQTVTWESSDENILTVTSGGVVYAVNEGTAVITATTVGTTASDTKLKATCTVTVDDYIIRGSCGDNINFVLKHNNILEITGKGAMSDYSSTAAPWHDYATQIAAVTISEGVTSISANAFSDCTALSTVTLPASIKTLGKAAFSGCSGITSLTLNTGLKSIGDKAFNDCALLTSIDIPASVTSIGAGVLGGCVALTDVTVAANNRFYETRGANAIIGKNSNALVAGCRSTVIPASVTSINAEAFRGCTPLTSVTIPKSVTYIGDRAFADCSHLAAVYCLAESMPATSGTAFSNSSISTATLYVPEALLEYYSTYSPWSGFGTKCAINATLAESIELNKKEATIQLGTPLQLLATILPAGATQTVSWTTSNSSVAIVDVDGLVTPVSPGSATITAMTVDGTGLSATCALIVENDTEPAVISGDCGENVSYRLSTEGVLTISGSGVTDSYDGNQPWRDYRSQILSAVVSDGITGLGAQMFEGCSVMTSVSLPSGLTSIDEGAFSGCSGLISITIPENVKRILSEAFRRCTGLTSVTLPSQIELIGHVAFAGCTSLNTVTCPATSVPELVGAFDDVPLASATLYVPSTALDAYKTADVWKDFGTILPIGDPTPSAPFQGAKRVFGENLLQSYCAGSKTYIYHYDDNGFVTRINRGDYPETFYTITYGEKVVLNSAFGGWLISATLNERGYIGSLDYYKEHWELSYNDDDQLTTINYNNGEHVVNLIYSEGNLVQVSESDGRILNFSYETDSQKKIENVGHIMDLENIFDIDIDLVQLFYYAGALGKATSHLPLTRTYNGSTITLSWTLDSKGNAVSLMGSDGNGLSWSWAEGGDAPSDIISGKCGENVYYVLSADYTLTLSGTGPMYDYGTSNQPWKDYTSRIADLIIGEGITGIGENAFNGCSGITSITLPLSVTAVGNNAFYGCKLRSVVARQTDPQNYRSAFSGLTYIHALLYVPQSTYWDYVYVGEWGTFIHIREYATTTQARQAYMLADETGTVYTVFNGESGALANVDVENGISEDELGNNWVVESYGARQSLLNLGANKYARFDENGTMSLSDTPQAMDIVIENGVADFNGRQMMLVINEDETVTKVVEARYSTNAVESGDAPIYDLSGRRLMKKPSSGFYIKNGKKYVVK